MTTFPLPTPRATRELARRVAPLIERGDLVILTGPLGSGKTYFTRALCRALGLPPRVRVPSPTFTLVHEHATSPPLSHADLYRLRDGADVRSLGLDSQRDDGRVLVVEWGEPYIELLGGDALIIELSLDPRRADVRSSGGPRGEAIVQALGTSGASAQPDDLGGKGPNRDGGS